MEKISTTRREKNYILGRIEASGFENKKIIRAHSRIKNLYFNGDCGMKVPGILKQMRKVNQNY